MRLHLSPAAAASLLLMLPPSSEGKLGAPRHEDQQQTQHLPQNMSPIGDGPHPHHPHRRSLVESSCYEHPGQFRYRTQTNGDVLISCSRLILQVARGVVSASNISKKCTQPLIGDYRYGPGATVADACPALCGRPCDDQHTAAFEEEDSPDLVDGVAVVVDEKEEEEHNTDGVGGDVIRLPENDSNEDMIVDDEEEVEDVEEEVEVEPAITLIEPNPPVDTQDEPVVEEQQQAAAVEESPSIIETIQSQVEQELTESEDEEYGDMTPTIDLIVESEDEEEEDDAQIDRPTPTIATFGELLLYMRPYGLQSTTAYNISFTHLNSLPSVKISLQNQSNAEMANGEMSSIWN